MNVDEGKIVSLDGHAIVPSSVSLESPQVDSTIVQTFERLLSEAKTGKISAVGIVVQNTDHGAEWLIQGHDLGYSFIGAVSRIQHHLHIHMEDAE